MTAKCTSIEKPLLRGASFSDTSILSRQVNLCKYIFTNLSSWPEQNQLESAVSRSDLDWLNAQGHSYETAGKENQHDEKEPNQTTAEVLGCFMLFVPKL